MKIKSIAVAGAVAALTLIPAGSASAYDNCAEARADGVYNLDTSDPRAAGINDPDHDGIVCENGSKPNTPVQGSGSGKADEPNPSTTSPTETEKDDKALAETGGDSKTPYVAGLGALLLIGGGALAFRRKRQN